MENTQPQLLSGMFLDAAFLHHYCTNCEACLLEVAVAAGVDRGAAKELFVSFYLSGASTIKKKISSFPTMLVPVSATSLIDCKALEEYVRNATGLQCSFAIKPMTLTDHDLR